jgi:hypothetical protein
VKTTEGTVRAWAIAVAAAEAANSTLGIKHCLSGTAAVPADSAEVARDQGEFHIRLVISPAAFSLEVGIYNLNLLEGWQAAKSPWLLLLPFKVQTRTELPVVSCQLLFYLTLGSYLTYTRYITSTTPSSPNLRAPSLLHLVPLMHSACLHTGLDSFGGYFVITTSNSSPTSLW